MYLMSTQCGISFQIKSVTLGVSNIRRPSFMIFLPDYLYFSRVVELKKQLLKHLALYLATYEEE